MFNRVDQHVERRFFGAGRMQQDRQMRGRMKPDEPMAGHTSWRVGGRADRFYIPADVEDLCDFLAGLPVDEPLVFIGLGSNMLVRDGGIRGTVVAMKNVINEMVLAGEGQIRAGAGVPCARVARFSVKSGLTGAEFLVGIPGTIGGALAMNAGAFGGETWDIVTGVETVNRRGERHMRTPSDYAIGYRTVRLPAEEWFLSASLRLQPEANDGDGERIRELLARRSETQPMGEFSCGSVFRNPPDDYAARLIEACGLKGRRIGGARVSEKHANFIINDGDATAKDIEILIENVADEVEKARGVRLQPEVRIFGETA